VSYPSCAKLTCEPDGTTASDGSRCACSTGFSGGGDWQAGAGGSWADQQGKVNYKCTRATCPGGKISADFVCTCDPGNVGGGKFIASNRTYPVCVTVPCLNGNIVTSDGDQECACSVGFKGGGKPQKDNSYVPCIEVGCAHGAVSKDRSFCTCDVGHQGGGSFVDKDDVYPQCKEAPCPNGEVGAGRKACTCSTGFTGGGNWDIVAVAFPKCTEVDCPDGTITANKKNCVCSSDFNGGGPFHDGKDAYPECFLKNNCTAKPSCGSLKCGYVADGCGGMASCGACAYGTVCTDQDGTCSRTGVCTKVVLHQSTGLPVGGWKPQTTGETYTKVSHWAARPAFKCADCGWGKETYLYWYPANDWPAELEVGWYVATELGSSSPLAYLPERVSLPTAQTTAWRFKSGANAAWQKETTVTTRCAEGAGATTHDYHGSAKIIAAGNAWYGAKTCLLFGTQVKKCVDEM